MRHHSSKLACWLSVLLASAASASTDSIGLNGINSAGLLGFNSQPLTGAGVAIGQVEPGRPGKSTANGGSDNAANSNSTVVPTAVFLRNGTAVANQNIDEGAPVFDHAEQVAGVMISTDAIAKGVATGAQLYATADGNPANRDEIDALSAQHIIDASSGAIRAVNISFGNTLESGHVADGNSLFTSFVDWSASTHNILYVAAQPESGSGGGPVPSDNYNGITVAASTKINSTGEFRRVADFNDYGASADAFGPRTSTELLAPGDAVDTPRIGNVIGSSDGTSFAAPHVAGTVALLQQYANQRIPSAPRWTVDARRHEVMKAVLVNSADKLKDDGTFAPVGSLLGMEKTIVDIDDTSTWLDSPAYTDVGPGDKEGERPLDLRMGAGQLNAKRALTQYAPGEYHATAGPVPVRAWDYGTTSGDGAINKYVLDQPIISNSFISITMAWDRQVTFENDANRIGRYDIGDTFVQDCCFSNLDLYLVPAGSATLDDAITASVAQDPNDTLEHIFFQIPPLFGGNYEIWVHQFNSSVGDPTNYALAWWAVGAYLEGDYSGNGSVGQEDYVVWRNTFGASVTAGTGADGNKDGVVNSADYVIWRKQLNAGSGSSFTSVPEPSAICLAFVGMFFCVAKRRSA